MQRGKKLIQGVGINDADYVTRPRPKNHEGPLPFCPFFRKWNTMLARCYSSAYKKRQPTYADCFVCEEWLTFSNFKAWMETQDWQDKHLDKDILVQGNKEYCPEKCVFVSQAVNNFFTEHTLARGKWPIGVSWHKAAKGFTATGQIPGGGIKYLGLFDDPDVAHKAYKEYKAKMAVELAATQTDQRVAEAILKRYAPEVNYE
jgi:hypothetical protein